MSIFFCCSIVKIIFKKFVEYAIFSKPLPLLHSFDAHAIMTSEGNSGLQRSVERVVFMIYTKRQHLTRYLGLSDSLDSAIRHLLSTDLSQLHKGRNEIDGDQAFVNRFDYQTMPPEQAIWEGHARYGDIHVLLSGHEKIGVTNAAALKMTDQRPEDTN